MKVRYLFLLLTVSAPLMPRETNAQDVWDLVRDVYEGKSCPDTPIEDGRDCQFRVGEDLHFEIADIGIPEAFINVIKSDQNGDFYLSTTPIDQEDWRSTKPCIIVKTGAGNPRYRMIIHWAYVSPRTGDVYENQSWCQRDGDREEQGWREGGTACLADGTRLRLISPADNGRWDGMPIGRCTTE